MATKKGKQVRGFWSNYKRLPLIFFLYITLCLISTPSSAWAAYIYTELLPPGYDSAYPTGINDKGDVIGWADVIGVGTGCFIATPFRGE